jgi:hypothetical protein
VKKTLARQNKPQSNTAAPAQVKGQTTTNALKRTGPPTKMLQSSSSSSASSSSSLLLHPFAARPQPLDVGRHISDKPKKEITSP